MRIVVHFAIGFSLIVSAARAGEESSKIAATRGQLAVRGTPNMNPPLWSQKAFDTLWKQWGLKEKPADYEQRVRERYGLHPAPYPNNNLPMGLHVSSGLLGKGIINDCLMCHASVVAGQTIIGAGNSALDLQSLFDDLNRATALPFEYAFRMSHARGTVDPVSPVAFLMEFRTPDLEVKPTVKLDYFDNVLSDPPAWWLLKKKKTRNWTGGVDVRSIRIDIVNLLTPLNSPEHIKSHEKTFADIHAFVLGVESPRYPFPIDTKLADVGRQLFKDTCARCHGTYGPDGKYPNKVVPAKDLGVDPVLADAISSKNLEYFNKSWFAQEKSPDGSPYRIAEARTYQAPPLDGIWATAPYFHNASVPTLYHVLNSKARPRIFTRSYGSTKTDYDDANVGWKITVLDKSLDAKSPGHELRRVYDTTLPGRSNAGHTFGDEFNDAERRAVVEYLKTL